MGAIIDKITEFIKEMLQGWVLDNLSTMFTDVNDKVGTIAGEVGRTPSSWNSGIFSMIQSLSENVMVPIAGLIISAILCYELITMVMDKNNMHEIGSEFFFRYLVKACVAVLLVSYTFDITMAIFDVGNHIVTRVFDSILKKAGLLDVKGKKFTPHGLRHLFAVQNIKKCVEAGEDFANWMEYLCQYMGHKHIKYTLYYLHITSQLFPVYQDKLRQLEEGIGVKCAEE